ncbi:MAG: glycosyltransferase family 2 protein [Candidatus Omnitrophica bacterium]|nr:glycosyltransferase family 2 protein [Candidatus Omnitrophota bacterium]
MKTCVIIPTYNEAKAIGYVLRQIPKEVTEVVVIDDGSTDATSLLAQDNGAVVLRNQKNEGKGASLIKGFDYAISKSFDAVITMDGDGQHLPQEILFFIQLARHSEAAIFIGNRMSDVSGMPWIRIVTNKIMSWFLSKITGQSIPDSQCGFRLIKRPVLEKIKFRTHRYETESEILIKAARLGFKIVSVPIRTIYLRKKSQINPFWDTVRFLRFILRELWTTKF